MMSDTHGWLHLLCERAAQAQLGHIDLLVDAGNLAIPLPRAAELQERPQMALLLQGTPEDAIASAGPLLFRLRLDQLQQPWLHDLLSDRKGHQHLLAFLSTWPFPELVDHLCHCTQVEWNGGRSSGLLRYYDPRLLVATSEALAPNQMWFHAPVTSWHWLDRDRQPRSLAGFPQLPAELPSPLPALRFEREQVAGVLAWTAAEIYRRDWDVKPQDYGLATEELLIRHLVHAQLEANRAGLHDPDERDEFVRAWLARHSPAAPHEAASHMDGEHS